MDYGDGRVVRAGRFGDERRRGCDFPCDHWLKQTAGFQPVVNMRTGETYRFPSPWAPSTYDG